MASRASTKQVVRPVSNVRSLREFKQIHERPDDNHGCGRNETVSESTPDSLLIASLHVVQAGHAEFVPTVEPSKWVRDRRGNDPEYRRRYEEAVALVKKLTKRKEFKRHFPVEAKAQENEMYRAKSLDPCLSDFRNYLIHVGIRPDEGWSVDRENPRIGYVLGNMRWADKQTQTGNRRITKWHKLPDGRSVTTSELAAKLGIQYDTCRKSLQRGNSVEALLDRYGVRVNLEHAWQFPERLSSLLEQKFREYRSKMKRGDSRLAWYCREAPKMLDELRNLPASSYEKRLFSAFQESINKAQAELEEIRNCKKLEKSKLILAVLEAFREPNEGSLADDCQPKNSLKTRSSCPEDDVQDLIDEHPAFYASDSPSVSSDATAHAMAPITPIFKPIPNNSCNEDERPATLEEVMEAIERSKNGINR